VDVSGEDGRVELARAVGLRVGELARLGELLHADFQVGHWGYAQFSDLADVRLQAILSDHLLAASEAVLTNLLEARVAEMDYNEVAGPGESYTPEISIEGIRADSEIIEFFRAFGSTLDCLAGVAVGVLRVPRSIVKASMSRDIFQLDSEKAVDPAVENAWGLFRSRLDDLRAGPPEHWMDWALLYRNAAVHRPRQINMQLNRPPTTSLILPASSIHELLRYDTYLRRRPWLPELEHLAADRPMADLFLAETATQTIRGLMEMLNKTTEVLAGELRQVWEAVREGKLALPSPPWKLDQEPNADFAGFAPDVGATFDEGRGHPSTLKRFELAEHLRQHERRGRDS